MAFLWVLADDIVEAIFEEDFGLSDGDESEFEGGNDIHALLGQTVLRHKDLINDYLDEENTSEEQDNDAIEMPEVSAEIEDEHKGLLALVYWVTHVQQTVALEDRVTGGERRRREMEVRKHKTCTNCSV